MESVFERFLNVHRREEEEGYITARAQEYKVTCKHKPRLMEGRHKQ